MQFSAATVNDYMHSVWRVLAVLNGCADADRKSAPLRRYINTGRAPTPFLKALIGMPPSRIAEALQEDGSDDEVIACIKEIVIY